ncbi:autotransporter-associated beta strand protein [Prosthecobacter fusiformis]|uniref:Autotransporter-associated beta strand protein n=1 Tax=Prosthecobacter fusiformis TaxID=48464 RepID=A0A4R7RYY7_9BACT|nr:autotransporter-associated beta strand repeat-containing protein [Prosthecobacter fusiformis]TDU71150.1 autotransporter-associated beta strand protein [Prosthecobacter fusiformis]
MKSNLESKGAIRSAFRLTAGLGLALLAHAPAGAQAPVLTKVDASSIANSSGSWQAGPGSYSQTTMITATASNATRVGTSISTTIVISNPGAGYLPPPAAPPAVTISAPSSGGTRATAHAVVSPEGRVTSIVVDNVGSNYPSSPSITVTIAPPAPGGIGSSVRFTNDISSDRTITLDGARTVGKLLIGDLSSSQIYTLAEGDGGVLTFDNAGLGGGAYINKTTGGSDVISAPIVLDDQLNVRVATSRLTLSNTITGNGNTLTSYGNGVLSLTGDNTGSDFTLWLWNRGGTGTGVQVELGATTGNAAGGDIIIGNATRGTSGHAVLQLLTGRTNLDQISDTATLTFDSFSGSGRNTYFKLMGGSETVGRILDLGSLAVIQNRDTETTVTTGATLTVAGDEDSYVSGYIRDNGGSGSTNLLQSDSAGTPGTRALSVVKDGAGTFTMRGTNIYFTGGLNITEGTVHLNQTTNFRSDVTNNGTLILENTGTWNFQKSFTDISKPEYLRITGSGSVVKQGTGTLNLLAKWNATTNSAENHQIGNTLTVRNGVLNLTGIGTGTVIGNSEVGDGLVIAGDSGSTITRNVNLLGRTTINGNIDATGRFNVAGSALTVRGATYETNSGTAFEAGRLTVNGSIKLTYMDLRLGSNNAVSGNASNLDGVIDGNISSLTLVGRPGILGSTKNGGGLFISNNVSSNNTNRFADGAAINMKGGVIHLTNDAAAGVNFSETLGALNLLQGSSQIANTQAATGRTSTLTFGTLTRNAGATVEFGGLLTNGTADNTTLGTTRNKILITGATNTGFMGAWATSGNEFVKYNTVNGVTQFTAGDYMISTGAATGTNGQTSWTPATNLKLTSSATLATSTSGGAIPGHRAINSLNLQSVTTAAAANRTIALSSRILSIESGGLLSNHGNHTISATTGYLTVGTAAGTVGELITTVGTATSTTGTITTSSLTISAPIRDFSLTLGGTTTYMDSGSNKLNIPANNAQVLKVGMAVTHPNLPPGTVITEVVQTDTTTQITLSNAPISGGLVASSQSVVISGGSVGLTKAGPGTLVLSSTTGNTYSGPTIVNNGILSLRHQDSLGTAPSSFVSNQVQINGGTLQFTRAAAVGETKYDFNYGGSQDSNLNGANRGFYFGESGGRLEVGTATTNPGESNNPLINVTIANPIDAYGLVELAVKSNTSPNSSFTNTLTLGTQSSTNQFRGGIKTEGSYNGTILVNGNNYINGFLMEGSNFTLEHDNDFSGPIRIFGGTLTLNGSNTYNGSNLFTETIIVGGRLVMGSSTALGTEGFKINLSETAEFRLNGTNQTLRGLTGVTNSRISNGSVIEANLTINIDANETFSGEIVDGGFESLNLHKTGPGRLTLTNEKNDFSRLTISEGVLDVTTVSRSGRNSAIGRGIDGSASEIVINGGALSFTLSNEQYTDRSFTMGAGINGATLVANGVDQAARIILGENTISGAGTINEERTNSAAVAFIGSGSRTLTLSGSNLGDNEFQLQLSDKSITETTSLLKTGAGTWVLGTAGDFTGQVTVHDGALAIAANNVLGTTGIHTTVDLAANTFTGNLPNGVEVSFLYLIGKRLPLGILPNQRYYVIESDSIALTFKLATTRSSTTAIDIESPTQNADLSDIRFIPNIQAMATTVATMEPASTFTGNLPNGTAVVFATQIGAKLTGKSDNVLSSLPNGIVAYETYYVMNATGNTFQVSKTLSPLTKVTLTSNSTGNIYYKAEVPGNTSEGIAVLGGRLELRNVDYITPETVTFQGGALTVGANTEARWSGNFDIQSATNFTVASDSELTLDGNLLGNRAITQLGEGTVRLRGETLMPTQPNAPGATGTSTAGQMDNSRRSYTVQSGTLILDYSLNNNSKLVDLAALVLGGSRRGGELRLQGGNHEEIISGLTLSGGANRIYRDSGTSSIRLNTITRGEGSTLYFDLARIASVDNLNTNNILGGWAVIRDAVAPARWVIPGTVSKNFSANAVTNVLSLPLAQGSHFLSDGTAVRLTTVGTLPAPLQTGVTYYVTNAGTRTFKLSEVPFGLPIDILDTGTAGATQHTVATYLAGGEIARLGAGSLIFTANQDNYPGVLGNNVFQIEIDNVATTGPITSVLSGGFPNNLPIVYKITTTSDNSSTKAIVEHVNSNPTVTTYFTASASTLDTTADPQDYPPTYLNGGSDDTGSDNMGWARNGSNSADGLVQVNTNYSNNAWGRNLNTTVNPNLLSDPSLSISPLENETFTLRFAASAPSTINLSRDELYTLQTGSILISPSVGANDSTINGVGNLTTENSGNLRNFLIHQYNELGDLVIGADIVNREPFTRLGSLTRGDLTILSGLSRTDDLLNVPVSGSVIPEGATVTEIIDAYTVRISEPVTSTTAVREGFIFTIDAVPVERQATTQNATTQNRINGIVDSQGRISTADLYIGIQVSGPGIPAGATVTAILNDADIQISTNHFFNGLLTQLTFTPTNGLEKLGKGTLILNGNNTYDGVTFLADGMLRALKLTDGGVAGSLGISSALEDNLNFNGGTLQYVGENSSTNRGFTITDYAVLNIGHEKTTSLFTGNIKVTGQLGASDRLEKTGSGTLEMRGSGSLNAIKVDEGKLRVQVVDLNPSAATTTASNLGGNLLTSLHVSGGAFELRGLAEANATQTYGGSFYVGEGSSEVRAISVVGFNPANLSSGEVQRSTTLTLMGGDDMASLVRMSGGTVRFVESPEGDALGANIVLNAADQFKSVILPWAVYENTTNVANPGVNDFASIEAGPTANIISADVAFLYKLGPDSVKASTWGLTGAKINASEGGTETVEFLSGVTVVEGSTTVSISSNQSVRFNRLMTTMSVFGPGIVAGTRVLAIDKVNRTVTLNNAATLSSTSGVYTFEMVNTINGYVGVDSSNPSAGADREVNSLRYYSNLDSLVTINDGSTLKITSGAILVGANVRGGNKSILGEGDITGGGSGDFSNIIIHNYNAGGTLTIGANVVQNIIKTQRIVGGVAVGYGSVTSGETLLDVPYEEYIMYTQVSAGMKVTGEGIATDTYVTSVVDGKIYLSKPAISTEENEIYSFHSVTSFVQAGIGTTILSGDNTYTGNTFVHGGVLRLDSANAVPGGITASADEDTSSHIIVKDGVVGLGLEDFTRNLGTANNQIEFKGSGGFAAYGADRVVDFGGAGLTKRLRFGNEGFVADGSSLILGAADATHKVIMANPIDLGSFSQAVRVNNGPADIEGELAGPLSGIGKLIKFGLGSLRLNAANTHTGGIEISEGRLVAANVANVFGTSTGIVSMGTSTTNTSKNGAIELTLEGGVISNSLKIGSVNSKGSDWVTRGTVANVASHSSMMVVNGYPAIAYYDTTSKDLKFVRAADARGNSWLAPVTLASRGDVGQYPSLSIINGNPAVSYYNATNGTLSYIRSNDASGVTWAIPVLLDTNPVNVVAAQPDGKVVVGGTFVEFDGVVKSRLVRLLEDGGLDPDFNVTVNGEVRAIVIETSNNNNIIIAGAFTQVNGVTCGNIARLSSAGVLDVTYTANASGGAVRALLLQPDGKLLVGGAFTSIGGSSRNRLARLETTGLADNTFAPDVNNEVFALARQTDGAVVFGGTFTQVNSITRNRVARVSSLGVLEDFNPNASAQVSAVAVAADNKIYIGGTFATVTGTGSTVTKTRNRLARLNSDGTVDTNYAVEVNAEVRGLRRLSTDKIALYGIFTGVGQTPANYLARLNSNGEVDETFLPDPDYEVRGLDEHNGKLVIGGLFSNVGGATQQFVGRLLMTGVADTAFNKRRVNDRGQYSSLCQVTTAPAISYYDVATGDLRFVRGLDVNGAAWGAALTLASEGDVGKATSMKIVNIGGDLVSQYTQTGSAGISGVAILGTPAIAYHDETNGDLKYILSNNADGSFWGKPVTVVATSDHVGDYLSLAMVDGAPAIAYYNTTDGDLEYVYSVNTNGTKNVAGVKTNLTSVGGSPVTIPEGNVTYTPTWSTPRKLDESGDVGLHPSLAVVNGQPTSATGFPAVAYYDATNMDLKYIRAGTSNGLASPNPAIPAWGTPIKVQTAGNVGQYANLAMTDGVAGISYQDGTTVKFLHLSDATGYSKIDVEGNTTLAGGINLDGSVLFAPDLGQTLTITGALTGAGGIRLISEGSLLISGTSNNFGTGLGADQEAPVVIRTGDLLLGSSNALGTNRVDLGDSSPGLITKRDVNGNVVQTNPQVITVERATTGFSLIRSGGRFDAQHNGRFGNVAEGPGAFVEVSTTIDGHTYTQADEGTLILVKDEIDNPAWNGVYSIQYASGIQLDGTMNLVRAPAMDELAEFGYGIQVRITDGTFAGKAYFLASKVVEFNASPVHWVNDAPDAALALRANVSGLTIANDIDVNSRLGAGAMSLGAAQTVTTGNVTFTGAITLQDNQPATAELQTLRLDSSIASGYGVSVNGLISESHGTSASGAPADVLTLSKTGTGVVTLRNNSNSFHGGVTVDQGTLLIMNTDVLAGSATGSGTVTVNAAAVLGGTGRIGGAVNLIGTGTDLATRAILRPGDPTLVAVGEEKLTIGGALTVGANSVVEFALGSTNWTKLAAETVSMTPTGRLVVTLTDLPAYGTVFDLMDLTTTLTFTAPGAISLRDYLKLPGEYEWNTDTFLTDGKITLVKQTEQVSIVSITRTPDSAVNPGQSMAFTVTVTGSPVFKYQWQRSINAGPFENYGPARESQGPIHTTNVLTLPSVVEADQGSYRVVVSNGDGVYTQTSSAVELIVNDPPSLTVLGSHVKNPGETATFTITASGPNPYTSFVWKKGATVINSGGRFTITSDSTTGVSTLVITDVSDVDTSNNYNVTVGNAVGNTVSNSASLTVNKAIVITQQPINSVIAEGETANFNVVVSATSTAPINYQWQWDKDRAEGDYVAINDIGIVSNTNQLSLAGLTNEDSGFRVRVRVWNVVGEEISTAASIMVQGNTGVPVFLDHPASQTVLAGTIMYPGDTVQLVARVGGSATGRKLQWRKGTANVRLGEIIASGIKSTVTVTEEVVGDTLRSTLTITNITPALMGEYNCLATNSSVLIAKNAPVSKSALVAVVSNNPDLVIAAQDTGKEKATMTVTVSSPKLPVGTVIQYLWKKNGADIEPNTPLDPLRITGVTAKTLVINRVTAADRGIYTCIVTGPGDLDHRTAEGGRHDLRVYDSAPVLGEIVFPPAMVGADFEYRIPVELGEDGSQAPVSYKAVGLPAGLKLDVKTGWITGRPTTYKAGGYMVTLTAINKIKPDPLNNLSTKGPLLLNVQDVPTGVVGIYAGWLPRHELNGNVGGRFDLTTTSKGAFSGKVTLGSGRVFVGGVETDGTSIVYSFKGTLTLDPTLVNPQMPTATVSILRKAPLSPLTLTFTLNPTTDLIASASLSNGSATMPFTGWRSKWTTTAPATAYVGYHTFAMMPPTTPPEDADEADEAPQGDSYAYFTVKPDGKLSMVGKTADGQTISGAQFVGPSGQILIYQILYKTTVKGSLVGQVSLNPGVTSTFADNTITVTSGLPSSAPSWSCPPNLIATNYVYPQGFNMTLGVTGGAYEDPTRANPNPSTPYPLILGLTAGTNNADLKFYLDQLDVPPSADPSLPYPGAPSTDTIDVIAGNKVLVPVQITDGPLVNPSKTTLSVVAKTGLFSGKVNLIQIHSVVEGKPIYITRSSTFQGIIVKEGSGLRGVGYYLMPMLPTFGTGQTVAKMQKVSNQVEFAPADQ